METTECQLVIKTKDGKITKDYDTRHNAQVDIDSKFVFRIIEHDEWDRLTEQLSAHAYGGGLLKVPITD